MTLHNLLQQLHRLDGSSSRFHDKLCNILYGEEYKKCVLNLQKNDLAWLVDYLDKVRCQVTLPHSPLKLAKALDDLDPASPAFRKCLREVRKICGTGMILPTSYTISPSVLKTDRQPLASGSSGDIYEGTLSGSKVCVKRVRIYSKEGPENVTKVRHRPRYILCLHSLMGFTDALQGSRGVETLGTPKHRPPPRYHFLSSPAYFRMDAWWRSDGTH